jgi:Family of unknown function (DUF6282)
VFDAHVHSAPCVLPRLADDAGTVSAYEAEGFTGCVLKGHMEPTVGRARAATQGRGLAVYGGIVLNSAVGGLNPHAVEASLALGARVVWMPTLDARAHPQGVLARPFPHAPRYGVPPLEPAAEEAVREICALVATADAVLATGHLGGEEIAWLLPVARAAGVERFLVTHASFTVPGLDGGTAHGLAREGAYIEVTAFQLLHQPGMTAGALARFISEAGPERCILSSDAGQPDSPSPPEALRGLVGALQAEGLDEETVEAMASRIPEALVAP